ncbi:MAG: hypothetical protein ACREQ5_05080 [Candidatus Dormibacteria bacterium]
MALTITSEDADLIAAYIVDKLVERLSDEKTVQRLSYVWSASLDKMLGRGLRKVAWLVFLCFLAVGFFKYDVLGHLIMNK